MAKFKGQDQHQGQLQKLKHLQLQGQLQGHRIQGDLDQHQDQLVDQDQGQLVYLDQGQPGGNFIKIGLPGKSILR